MEPASNSAALSQPETPAEDSHLEAQIARFNGRIATEQPRRKAAGRMLASNLELLKPKELAAFVRIPYETND